MKKYMKMEWVDVERLCKDIAIALMEDDWKPNIIVGIQDDGLIPARILSSMLDCSMVALDARIGDNGMCVESNLWLAEDALGISEESPEKKNILIVDGYGSSTDLYDTIVCDWMSGCYGDEKLNEWNNIWGNNVRFACLALKYNIQYYTYTGTVIDDNSMEVEFPWNTYNKCHWSV